MKYKNLRPFLLLNGNICYTTLIKDIQSPKRTSNCRIHAPVGKEVCPYQLLLYLLYAFLNISLTN